MQSVLGWFKALILCAMLSSFADAALATPLFSSMGYVPGSSYTKVEDVSQDGQIAVGFYFNNSTWYSFRWTEAGGIEDIGGYTARAISDDGSRIVGS